MGLQTVENLASPSRILASTGKVRQAASEYKGIVDIAEPSALWQEFLKTYSPALEQV